VVLSKSDVLVIVALDGGCHCEVMYETSLSVGQVQPVPLGNRGVTLGHSDV
jgi:hypothetical protein